MSHPNGFTFYACSPILNWHMWLVYLRSMNNNMLWNLRRWRKSAFLINKLLSYVLFMLHKFKQCIIHEGKFTIFGAKITEQSLRIFINISISVLFSYIIDFGREFCICFLKSNNWSSKSLEYAWVWYHLLWDNFLSLRLR